ncbi:hypothetical protein, partial [Enterococcus faecium]|uniref:hypothetical protein n=1 Tax=Enterococcus faecium TaxID=1352 RepID=UPI002930C4B6
FDTFIKYTDKLDLKKLVTGLIGTTPDKVIVTDPVYFDHLNDILHNSSVLIDKEPNLFDEPD